MIETKRAKSMATRIDVDIYGAVELLPKLPSMMNAGQYRLYATDVMGNVTETPDFWMILQRTSKSTPCTITIRTGRIMFIMKLSHKITV